MLTLLLQTILINLFNRLRAGVRLPRRAAKKPDKTAPDKTFPVGRILPSLLAPPGDKPTDLTITAKELRTHLYILGKTGTGKTTLIVRLLLWAVEQNIGIVLIDRRGEMIDRVLALLAAHFEEETLAERLALLDMRQAEYAFSTNPLRSETADGHSLVRAFLDVVGERWSLGVQTEQLLRFSLLALSKAWTLYELDTLLTNEAFRRQVLETVDDAMCRRFFARFDALPPAQQSQCVEPVLNKVSIFLSRESLRYAYSQRKSQSLHTILDQPGVILLLGLGSDTLHSDADLVGGLLLHSIAAAAMRAERRDKEGNELLLIVDEFEVFDLAGEQFSIMLAQARKFGLGLCLCHQAIGQLSPKLRGLIRSLVQTQVYFACGGEEATILANEIVSDEPKMAVRHRLMNQKIGEAIALKQGQDFARVRTAPCPDPTVAAEKVERLRLAGLQRYGTPRQEIERDLAERDALFESLAQPAKTARVSSPKPRTKAAPVQPVSAPNEPIVEPAVEMEVRDAQDNVFPSRRRGKGGEAHSGSTSD